MVRPSVVAALLAVAAFAGAARADVVHLRGGGRLVGHVTEADGKIRVRMKSGTLVLDPVDVLRVERTDLPSEILERRENSLREGDVEGALELARAAHDEGLTRREGELLSRAVEWEPGNVEAVRALRRWKIRDRVLDADPVAEAELVKDFGEGARVHRTAHWVMVHDVAHSRARRRAEMLEAAWRKFYDLADRLVIDPPPVERRLEVMLFDDHDRWRAALALPDEQVAGMNGMYVHSTGRILLYDTRTSPGSVAAQARLDDEQGAVAELYAQLETQREKLDELETALGRLGNTTGEVARRKELEVWIAEARARLVENEDRLAAREGELAAFEEDLDRYNARENLASTTHEACHQLAFATGISRPGQPLWMLEGLATLFEVESRQSFVIEAPNAGRLRDVRNSWRAGRVPTLRSVVSDRIFHDGHTPRITAYSESWSLAHFLAMQRTARFAEFVRGARPLPEAPGTADRRLADFERFFPEDLDALEREWRTYVDRL